MRDDDKVQRQVQFMRAQPHDSEDSSGKNNTWVYNRAPDGYKFRLVKVLVASKQTDNAFNGIFGMFDGHEYTRWDIWPGVESREYLTRISMSLENQTVEFGLEGWECKEYSIAVRSTNATYEFKAMSIVWYYLEKMSHLERLYYAVIQPRWNRYKKAFRTTLDPKDE